MIKTTSSKLTASIGLFLVLVGAVYWIHATSGADTITVINAGRNSIRTLGVAVCAADYMFRDIPSGSQSQATFTVIGDSGIRVYGQFSDETAINGSFGYVTKQFARQHVEIIVHADGSVTGRQ